MAGKAPAHQLDMWEVIVAAHHVPPRWDVAERRFQMPASEIEGDAKKQALRWAHADAGVPPLKHLLRLGWKFVSAKRVSIGV